MSDAASNDTVSTDAVSTNAVSTEAVLTDARPLEVAPPDTVAPSRPSLGSSKSPRPTNRRLARPPVSAAHVGSKESEGPVAMGGGARSRTSTYTTWLWWLIRSTGRWLTRKIDAGSSALVVGRGRSERCTAAPERAQACVQRVSPPPAGCRSVCLSVCLTGGLSGRCPSVCPSVCVSPCRSVCPPVSGLSVRTCARAPSTKQWST